MRGDLLCPCTNVVVSLAKQLEDFDSSMDKSTSKSVKKNKEPPEKKRRILVLPGIMGSLLHDRSGKLGAVWIDPWNLIFGNDFDELKLKWEIDGKLKKNVVPITLPERIPDADDAVQIEAYGVVPIIYDRMALALMNQFGPIVEYVPFDWRQPIGYPGKGFADRIESLVKQYPDIEIAIIAHSMGGLIVSNALSCLEMTNSSLLNSIKVLVFLGAPFLGSSSVIQALRAERSDLNLLKLLRCKSTLDIENTVQTFRGLFDMLPRDQEELLKPAIFSPGPLSNLSTGDSRLSSPFNLVRDLPSVLMLRTRTIVNTTKKTIDKVQIHEDGSVDYSCTVAGDGTVSVKSALNAGKLLPQSYEVNAGHMTLPLDGKAIKYTIDWIEQQFGVEHTKSNSTTWPDVPDILLPNSREEIMQHLESEDELTLGDFIALISLI